MLKGDLDIGRRRFFYWPARSQSNWLSNKNAVRNCQDADTTTWIKVPILQIVKHCDVFYEAVRCTVTLKYFNIDASAVLNSYEVYEKLVNHICLNTISIEKLAASFSSEDIYVSRSSMDCQELSPSLLDKKRVRIFHSTTKSSITSSTTATTKTSTTVSTDNLDRHDCDAFSLSPSLLERRSTRTSRCIRTVRAVPDDNATNNSSGDPSADPTSPSLLSSLFALRRYTPYRK